MLQKGYRRVVLIDDMCEIIAKNLYSKLDGIKIAERKLDNYFIDNLEKTSYSKFSYEHEYIVIVDASYDNPDLNISALDIVEKAILSNPDLKNNIILLLGADINELAPMLDQSGASTAVACKVLRELILSINK